MTFQRPNQQNEILKVKILGDWGAVIAVEKPAGWLSIPGRGNKANVPILSHTLGEQLRGNQFRGSTPDLYVVHRLDEGTSGVMLFAKNATAHRELNGLFEENKVEKIYWCFVKGAPKNQTVSEPIFKLPSKKNKSIVDPKGKPSSTEIQVLKIGNQWGLVEAKPLTGRSHQVRVHLSHLGNPLVGDTLYGGPSKFFNKHFEYPLLHCRELKFEWPLGQKREVVSDPHGDFSKLLKELNLNSELGL